MRNPKRIPYVLQDVEELWAKYPDMRLGQLLLAVADENLWGIEDEALQAYIYEISTFGWTQATVETAAKLVIRTQKPMI